MVLRICGDPRVMQATFKKEITKKYFCFLMLYKKCEFCSTENRPVQKSPVLSEKRSNLLLVEITVFPLRLVLVLR